MNNLLRTLTSNEVKSALADTDLKLLLSTVKEGRRHGVDTKLSDAFYDSLEGLLVDLRTVTMDNHDPEAFLKPVSKTDVPDYYDVISNPMDLQTMLKKVKSKQYKSKKEFKDDLDLIWINCLTYNASPDHPLRQCAKRLQIKSEKLLKNITDRKERTDPYIPSDLPGRSPSSIIIKPNGINGHARSLSSTPTPTPYAKSVIRIPPIAIPRKRALTDSVFPESPAIIRTAEGMSLFKSLDENIEREDREVKSRLRSFTFEETEENLPESDSEDELAVVGEKRKLNGFSNDPQQRKRIRRSSSTSNGLSKHCIELWWDVVNSDSLLANGFPTIVHSSSAPSSSLPNPVPQLSVPKNRRKRKRFVLSDPERPDNTRTLLGVMNSNIRTMHRLRNIHAKFSSIKDTNTSTNEEGGLALPSMGSSLSEPLLDSPRGPSTSASITEKINGLTDVNPFRCSLEDGIDIGSQQADKCLHWMGSKVLEHVGFQGSSRIALDVLSGVASEYLFNVGRTIQFLTNKYSTQMNSEEIILHALFESGITRVDDLERYIQDDVVRYGGRLTELEKKLDSAYRSATTMEEAIDDEAFFDAEDEEDNAFVMGDFMDALGGDDFLGLRELGIASELGLSNLSVPKKLMKTKSRGLDPRNASSAKPKEPPLPFPPPPPFIPIASNRVDDQVIGLLRPYYHARLESLAASSKPEGGEAPAQQCLVLPDDLPKLAQVKMSPLGQIAGGKQAAGTATNGPGKKKLKKEKEKEPPPQPAALGPEGPVVVKKRGGPGRGKKGKMTDLPPKVVVATT